MWGRSVAHGKGNAILILSPIPMENFHLFKSSKETTFVMARFEERLSTYGLPSDKNQSSISVDLFKSTLSTNQSFTHDNLQLLATESPDLALTWLTVESLLALLGQH